MRGTRVLIGMAAILFSGVAAVHAQDQDPSARVARTSYLQGDVSFRPGTVDDWTSATLNYPLTTGDHLWTDADARAELHVGANAIRLGPETAFEILDLDDNRLQIRLSQGSALVRLRTLDADDNVEIDTPTGAVTLMRDGTYRVDVSSDGATSTVTTRNGDAEVATNDQTVSVRPDETVLFDQNGASEDVRQAPPMDEYDEWALSRDQAEDESQSAQYVSRDMTGYEDLDRNGSWSDDPEYGHVWAPTNVAADWAPYRYGRWVWVEPYGWTWIDDAQWGFAPFHYGRWAYVRNRWVWAPGVVRGRPVYAPALVVFVGGNDFRDRARWGDRGGVAWFPLGPNEVYRPTYRASDNYVRRVNVTNVNITNINVTNINVTNVQYRNQRVNGAVTAVSQDQFAGSRRIGRTATVIPASEAQHAYVVGQGAPVAPTQQSVIIRRQNAQPVSRPPEAAQTRRVVVKNAPPPSPATFASHEDQLKTNGNAPVAPLPISQTRGAPRTIETIPATRTTGNTRVSSPVTAAPSTTAAPNTDTRRTRVTRPNVNVQRTPEEQTPAPQPNVNVRPAPVEQPNTNDRPQPRARPTVNDRPQQTARPNVNERAAPRTDGPVPVDGSTNSSPAHTVNPRNTDVRPVPSAQPSAEPRVAPSSPPNTRPTSRSDVQPNERPAPQAVQRSTPDTQRSPERGERPQTTNAPPRSESAPPRQAADSHTTTERRRVQGDDKPRQEQNDRPPHHG
jgi:hypothetical protein